MLSSQRSRTQLCSTFFLSCERNTCSRRCCNDSIRWHKMAPLVLSADIIIHLTTVKPPFKGHPRDKCPLPSGQRKLSPEWRCPFIRGNKYKDYSKILIFRDQSFCHQNRGVAKERFHCSCIHGLVKCVQFVVK